MKNEKKITRTLRKKRWIEGVLPCWQTMSLSARVCWEGVSGGYVQDKIVVPNFACQGWILKCPYFNTYRTNNNNLMKICNRKLPDCPSCVHNTYILGFQNGGGKPILESFANHRVLITCPSSCPPPHDVRVHDADALLSGVTWREKSAPVSNVNFQH